MEWGKGADEVDMPSLSGEGCDFRIIRLFLP